MRRGFATVFGLTVSAVSHAGWLLAWHSGTGRGCRDLADVEWVPQPCESS
jgi:hypothetical protein